MIPLFFLRNIDSMMKLAKTFKEFSCFSDLSLNGVEKAICSMKNIELTKDAVKIMGISFSYNRAVQNELNFRATIFKTQAVLKLWRMQRLSRDGKIVVFKLLAISKI